MHALRSTPRVSCFELSENAAVRDAVERLVRKGMIKTDAQSLGYPWIAIKFAAKARGGASKKSTGVK